MKDEPRVEIPVRPDLGQLGRKWTARILVDIGFRRVNRFGQIIRSNPGLTRRMLSRRLHELEAEGLVTRREFDGGTRGVTWHLTTKGTELLPILMGFIVFGSKWNYSYRFQGKMPTLAAPGP